ncbi:hypothetical protein [Nitrososphaera viennensis]|nr:hypothetical protein [Nitrososphaera viennensis]UVS68677.1 hypothetical protein NWT39_12320 [Nitrososphaera viennensis]
MAEHRPVPAHKVLDAEKKIPRERKQRFFLEIHYIQGINKDGKSKQMHYLVGRFPNNHGHGHYQIDLQSDLETVMAIAADRDIKWLGGEVYPYWQ